MLSIVVPGGEQFDPSTSMFLYGEDVELRLEHSLDAITLWEIKYLKPFLEVTNLTGRELMYYIECMTLNAVPKDVYSRLTAAQIVQIQEYMKRDQTAAVVYEPPRKPGVRKTITSDTIFYWMVSMQIPPQYSSWHISRLMTLIKIISSENKPPEKMSKKDLFERNRELNRKRRQEMNMKG